MDSHRAERVSGTLREELSELIGYEMTDPRVDMVDVAEVVVAPDMRHARVLISIEGGDEARQEALAALEGARHFLRRQLAARIRLFRIPELHFEADLAVASSGRVKQLMRRIRRSRPRPEESSQENPVE